jgi:hypothetical protein
MSRSTVILLGVLVVLVLIGYLVMQKPGEKSSTGERGEKFVMLDSLSVDKIEITAQGSPVVLQKKGVEWFLERPVSYRADQSAVAGLLHDMNMLEIRSTVSGKPEKHSVFQVDSTGTLVKVYEKGSEKASFIVGKMGSTYTELYARQSSSNDVVAVSGGSPMTFNKAVKEWRDRTIAAPARDAIKEVRYQYGDTTFVLAFRDSAWMVGRDSTEEWAVNNLISSLSNVQADDFRDSSTSRLSKPTAQITYAGTQLTFFYVKEGDKYVVQSSSTPQLFEMQSWRANQILKRKKEIIKSVR